MKIKNIDILDKLYKADPKVTPLTFSWLKYTELVNDVIVGEFRKEIGANPVKGSALELRIAAAAKTYAKTARRIFRQKKGTYSRATAQHFFKKVTHIRLRAKKSKGAPNPADEAPPEMPGPSGDAAPEMPSGPPPKKPFSELGRTQKAERVNKLKGAASGDLDLLMATAMSVAKSLDLNVHFVLKAMKKNEDLTADLKRYIEKDYSMYHIIFKKKNQRCM